MSIFSYIYSSIPFSYPLNLIGAIVLSLIVVIALTAIIPLFISGWIERKLAARLQSRKGPVFNGKFGLLQNAYDAIKLFGKEVIRNKDADRLFLIPPIIYGAIVALLIAIIPLGIKGSEILNVPYNMLISFILLSYLAIASILGGIFSGNKFSAISMYREGVKTFAFEGIILLTIIIIGSSTAFNFENINSVLFLYYPLLAVGFLVGAIAIIDRGPLDITEASQELVGGWRIEYGGLPYGLPLLGDYSLAFIVSIIFTILFLGGVGNTLLSGVLFWIKVFALFVFLITIRWTMPRPRIDQLIVFAWKYLLPMVIINILIVWAL